MTTNDEKPAELDRGGRAAPTWAGDRERSPDPVMIEKAREALWETFGAWPSGPLAAWLTEQDCERLARAALSAAGVPGLVAQVERLRNLVRARWDELRLAQKSAQEAREDRDAALARATSAEQERDRLRALAAEMLTTFTEPGHPGVASHRTGWVKDTTLARWRALLAESGEQAGEGCSPESRCTPWPREHTHARPAPVVPDSPDVLPAEVEREFRWHEANGPVIDDDRYMPVLTARRLAVVGQGVTAEAKADGWDEAAEWVADPHVRRGIRQANPYRAAVRPTGQEKADG